MVRLSEAFRKNFHFKLTHATISAKQKEVTLIVNNELHEAIATGDTKKLLLALAQGADPNSVSFDGLCALQRAAISQRSEYLTSILLNHGANASLVAKEKMDAIEWACSKAIWGVVSVICSHENTIISHKHYLAKDPYGSCLAAGIAAIGQFHALVRVLNALPELNHWVSPKGVDLLWLACESGHHKCALLLAKEANIKRIYPDGANPLHMTAKLNASEALKVILERGGDQWGEDEEGKLPLHIAAEYGCVNSCMILGQNKKALYALDYNGYRPIERAEVYENWSAHAALLALMEKDKIGESIGTPIQCDVSKNLTQRL